MVVLLSNSLAFPSQIGSSQILWTSDLSSQFRDLSSQIFGFFQIPGTCPLRFSAPLKFPWTSPLRFLGRPICPMSRPVPGRPNLRGPLSNLRGSSQNLRGVLWNPFNFLKEFEDFHGIHTKQARFHRTPLKFERISWDILSNLAAHRILSIFRGTLWNPLKIEEEFENFHGDPFKFERIP